MKKLVALVLALLVALSCTAVFAEAKTEYNVEVLVWKFDDTYGSSVRQGMMKWAEAVGDELGVKINLTMNDAGDDMAKQVEQCDQVIGKNPDFVIINLAEPAGGQTLVDKLTAAKIPFLYYNIPPSEETYDSVVKTPGAFFVGTLPREAGDMQGEILADMWAADPAAIDKNGDKCEGSWTIGDMSDESDAFLAFAGFGTLYTAYTAIPCEDPEVNCTSYLKSMSGNVAGWMPAPSYTTAGTPGSCTFCGEYDPGEEETVDSATAWDLCPCEEYADIGFTAVSGTWSIKYNATASKKLKSSATIVDAVKLPSNVKTSVALKILEVLGE